MGKYIKKSKIVGDVSVKEISHPTTLSSRTRAAKNGDSFAYLQLKSRRLPKLPISAKTRNPRAKSVPTEEVGGNNEGKSGSDGKTGDRNAPSSREIEDFFAYAEQQQQRLFTDKYNFDISSDNPLPGRYQWVKVVL